MDRNREIFGISHSAVVALRKESVDRNKYVVQCRKMLGVVALRKESVDRNYQANAVDQILPGSLSARRAWIEMHRTGQRSPAVKRRSPQGERG